MAVGSVGIEQPPDDDGGIKPGCLENGGGKRCGRCLAVRACHRDARAQAHQFGQHFRAGNDGDAPGARGHDLGIVIPHGGRAHHDLRRPQVFGGMADADIRAERAQLADCRALGNV